MIRKIKNQEVKTREENSKAKIMKSKFFSLFFISIVIFACTKEKMKHHVFKDNVWDSNNIVKFDVNFEDTNRLYNLDFSIRHITPHILIKT